MTLPKGWINRQVARMEKESQSWPDWMKREIDLRVQEQRTTTISAKPKEQRSESAVKKAGGA